jgi:DNA primase
VRRKESTLSDTFVDFKEIKQRVSMEAVLAHLNVKTRRVNQHSLRGTCPLPTHSSDRSKESFIVQTEKNIWVCQSSSCVAGRKGKKGGNILDFVSVMKSCSIRDAALILRDAFPIAPNSTSPTISNERAEKENRAPEETCADDSHKNKPLTFTLANVDHAHSYLRARGISDDTAKTFSVGFFSGRGSMIGRVVVPIHNAIGQLVAYAGRSVDDAEPKYKLPTGFTKSAEVFNLHRVIASPETARERVIVCEGFFDCMKVHQAGIGAVVALMGSSMSEAQENVLGKFARVILFLDGDEAGREATRLIVSRLAHRTFVRAIDLPDGKQPDQLSSEEIQAVLAGC